MRRMETIALNTKMPRPQESSIVYNKLRTKFIERMTGLRIEDSNSMIFADVGGSLANQKIYLRLIKVLNQVWNKF